MANFTFKHSNHASHEDFDGLTWVRNVGTAILTVTDEGHNLPGKTCGGMSSTDATTRALIDIGLLTVCTAPAAPKGKPRKKEAEKPDTEESPDINLSDGDGDGLKGKPNLEGSSE